MGFSRQEYWNLLPFPSPGDLPEPGIEPGSPELQGRFFTAEPPGSPKSVCVTIIYDTSLACLGRRNKVVVQTVDISFLTVLEAGGRIRVLAWSGSGGVSSHLMAGAFMRSSHGKKRQVWSLFLFFFKK